MKRVTLETLPSDPEGFTGNLRQQLIQTVDHCIADPKRAVVLLKMLEVVKESISEAPVEVAKTPKAEPAPKAKTKPRRANKAVQTATDTKEDKEA